MATASCSFRAPRREFGSVNSRSSSDTYNTTSDTDNSDMMSLTGPLAVARLMSNIALNGMARAEPDRFDALEKAGFKVIRYGDIIYQLFERFGGHYMDVGASAKIAKGLVSKRLIKSVITLLSGNALTHHGRSRSNRMLYPLPTPRTACSSMTGRSSRPMRSSMRPDSLAT